MVTNLNVYSGIGDDEIERLSSDIVQAYKKASEKEQESKTKNIEDDSTNVEVEILSEEVLAVSTLIGVDPSVYRQINSAIKSGKQHLMFYGPPGTGKTTIAQYCARSLASDHTLITGSSDWTSQDIIGGYQPIGNGKIEFIPGILLRQFDRPLIIDELNRCDIDKVIGPLFTVLSGQKTTLPYRVNVEQSDSEFYQILPVPTAGAKANAEFSPKPAWRLIATINSIDKASLYQMSYALTRRFAWIYVDVPINLDEFLEEFFSREGITFTPSSKIPLANIWKEVNKIRSIGPAPFIDLIKALLEMGITDFSSIQNESQATIYMDGFDMFILPMLDGIFRDSAMSLASSVCEKLNLPDDSLVRQRVIQRLMSIAA